MGNRTIAPATPDLDAMMSGENTCQECGHDDPLGRPDFILIRRLFRRPVVSTCSHVEVTQDALVDDTERCKCEHGWHH